MIRKCTLLFAAILAGIGSLKAQPLCGFDQRHQSLMAQDPAFAQHIQQSNAAWAQLSANPQSLVQQTAGGPAYEIPVVIHVMHTGGAVGSLYNPSTAQLTAMIDYLNKSYAATWASYPDSSNGGTYVPIRFTLAKRAPDCSPTNGIVRYNLGGNSQYVNQGVNSNINGNVGGLDDTTVKNFSRWPVADYYNIWVVNRINGADGTVPGVPFTAGFAYFPGAGYKYDGTVMLASQSTAGEITLPHEIGHAMGLYHTFQGDGGGGSCPPNTNCNTQGDLVCDTEPMKRSVFNCPSGINSCTGQPWQNTQRNFMDYSSCQNRFTPGQRARMISSLITQRASLLSSLGAVAPAAGPVAASCTPVSSNPSTASLYGIRRVALNDMESVSEHYYGDGFAAYVDRSCIQRANLTAGGSYPISVRTGTGGAERVRVYIDYDNDGSFQAGELVFSSNAFTTNHTGNITVPSTGITTCTPIRMRVMSDANSNTTMNICGPLTYGQAEDFSVYIEPLNSSNTVSLSLTNGSNPSCHGTTLGFTATPGSPASGISYKWYVNNAFNGTTTNTFSSAALANNSQLRVLMYYTNGCGLLDSVWSNQITIQRSNNLTASVSIALTSGNNPGCPGSSLTFTAQPVNGGISPGYQWQKNGVNIPGATAATYTTNTLAAGDVISLEMYPNANCATPASVTSNAITISNASITPQVSIAQTAGTTPTCAGQTVSFTATPTNGGSSPAYQWKKNGVNITGATAVTYTTNTLANGDVISVVMTSSDPCASPATATSNAITITYGTIMPSVSAAVTSGNNPGCAGQSLTFTATPTSGGSSPAYQWKKNGVNIAGATSATYTTNTLLAGDVISVSMVSNASCASTSPVQSNNITISFATITATISITQTGGANPSCAGQPVTFSATTTNGGTNPNIVWMVNGVPSGATGNMMTTASLPAGTATITAVLTSNDPCVTNNPVTSNAITHVVNPLLTPAASITLSRGDNPGCLDSLLEFTAGTTNMGASPAYLWLVNGTGVAAGPVYSSTTLQNGDVVSVRAIATAAGCRTSDTAFSNSIALVRSTVPDAPIISYIGGNLVSDLSNVQWYGPGGLIPGATGGMYHPSQSGIYYAVTNNNGCYSAPSNLLEISNLSVGTLDLSGIAVYPNPTSGALTLDFGQKPVNMKLAVYSSLGQGLMHEDIRQQTSKVLQLGHLASGIYFIVLRDEHGKSGTFRITLNQ